MNRSIGVIPTEMPSDKEYVFRYGEYMDSIGLTDVDLLDYIDIEELIKLFEFH